MYLFKYILKRLGLLIFTFFIIVTISFVLVKLLPNVPATQFGKNADLIKKRREMLGYDKSIFEQYMRFWYYAFQFEFGVGETLQPTLDVWDVFVSKLPYTVALNVYSSVLSIPIGLALGIIAAVKKNKWQDHLISTGVMIFVSVPSFIYGFVVKYLLCFEWALFEPTLATLKGAWSWDAFVSYIPAILCLSFGSIAGYARALRAELSEILTSDYLLLARTKGLTRNQATVRHALRNAMVPIFPAILGEFISVMSGSLIIENMFTIPGVGGLFLNSIQAQPNPDYNFFMLLTMFYILIGLLAGIIIDISYSIIDPRIRVGAR